MDLQYSDVRLDKGLYNRLVARGSMKRLVTEQQVMDAVSTPPESTRAYFRGECMRRFGTDIAAASWDSVIFDVGAESLVRIPTLEPLRGTRASASITRATAGRAALHAEAGAERGLAQAHHGGLADAVERIAEADQPYASAEDAVHALHEALIAANGLLAETVFEHNELTGMGTTVSALIRDPAAQ